MLLWNYKFSFQCLPPRFSRFGPSAQRLKTVLTVFHPKRGERSLKRLSYASLSAGSMQECRTEDSFRLPDFLMQATPFCNWGIKQWKFPFAFVSRTVKHSQRACSVLRECRIEHGSQTGSPKTGHSKEVFALQHKAGQSKFQLVLISIIWQSRKPYRAKLISLKKLTLQYWFS